MAGVPQGVLRYNEAQKDTLTVILDIKWQKQESGRLAEPPVTRALFGQVRLAGQAWRYGRELRQEKEREEWSLA